MSENESQSPAPAPIDPRLKSFLRQATAVITAEKGLNPASRIKLESLAKHVKLPQELFDEALVLLQSNDNANLTHYEKAFVKFLDGELGKIKGGVISLGMEHEAIDLAERKYQINSTRAEQLIKARAEAAGISRISPDEAAVFAERIIIERTNKLAAVNDDLRQDLYRIGKKWGYQRDQVDRIIFREIAQNRAKRRTAFAKRAAIFLSLILAAGLGVAFANGWLDSLFQRSAQVDPDLAIQFNNESIESQPVPEVSTFSQLQQFSKDDGSLKQIVDSIGQSDQTQRKNGLQELTEIVCSQPDYLLTELPGLISQLYFEEQSDVAAAGVLSAIKQKLQIQPPEAGVSVSELKINYRANRLLGQICFSENASAHQSTSRYEKAKKLIRDRIQIPVSEEQSLTDYLSRSEAAIAVDHWNFLNQTIWSPSSVDAAVLYGPVLALTQSKLDTQTLNSYRDETLVSLIEVDASEWNHLREPIRETISRCPEIKLNRWISALVKSDSAAMQDFLSPLILKRIDVKPKSLVRKDVVQAISNYDLARRDGLIKPVTSRNAQLIETLDGFLQKQTLNQTDAEPDQIADTALRVNIEMAFCAALENVTHIDDASFVQFDRMAQTATSAPLKLRELISLPIDRLDKQNKETSPATASDIERKDSAISRLKFPGRKSSSSRKLGLKQLAKIAPRFQRLSYAESKAIAAYLLSDLGTEELLNIQLQLGAFSHWPSLPLAIADELSQSDVKLDQALTISRLLLGEGLDIGTQDSNWKQKLQSSLRASTADQLSNLVDLNPNNPTSNWNRLRIYMNDAYRDRLMIVNKSDHLSQSFLSLDQASLELTRAIGERQRGFSNSSHQRKKAIVGQSSTNEVARTVLAGQFLIEVISSGFESTEFASQARGLLTDFESKMQQHSFIGQQLYQTELTLLRLFALKRELLVKQLRERN